MADRIGALRSIGVALAVISSSLAASALADQPDDCPTFFPDFRCDRLGRYEGFVMPMASPYLFEDPFITTGVSIHGIWHEFPGDSVFNGGDAWVAAVQARVAITDRLAFIATKDGYAFFDSDEPVLDDEEGFFDISAGLKYAVIDMPERDLIASLIGRIDIPVGNDQVFSGNGDGVFLPSLSVGWGLDRFHVIGDVGGRIPFDHDKESTSIFYHLHLDYAVHQYVVPFAELSGYHWTNSGDGTFEVDTTLAAPLDTIPLNLAQAALMTGRFEGNDLVNLGSRGVTRNDIVTLGFGVRFPITPRIALGALYEFPVTTREDLFKQRVSMNLTLEL